MPPLSYSSPKKKPPPIEEGELQILSWFVDISPPGGLFLLPGIVLSGVLELGSA
jgi:hypothetical protein